MTPAEEKRYVNYMADINHRINFLRAFDLNSVPKQIAVELFALQFRKIVEMIVFSSLVANRERYAALHDDFVSHWKISEIIRRIKAINKDYLPIPVEETEKNGEKYWDYPSGKQFFSEQELISIYKESGGILHSRKPFSEKRPDIEQFISRANDRISKFVRTLNCHQVHPLNDKEVFIVHIEEEEKPNPVIYRFKALPKHEASVQDKKV